MTGIAVVFVVAIACVLDYSVPHRSW